MSYPCGKCLDCGKPTEELRIWCDKCLSKNKGEIKPMKCPHCNRGKLEKPYHNFQYDYDIYTCSVCGRGWHQDKKGNWHSHFATDVEIYSKDGNKMLYNSTRDGPTIPQSLCVDSTKEKQL